MEDNEHVMHRMSLHEVGEVARRAAASGARVHGGGPTVHKVADALGLPPAEVEMLLDQSRQGGSPVRDFKVMLGVVALIVAFMLGLGTTSLFGHREAASTVASAPIASSPVSELPVRSPNTPNPIAIPTPSTVTPVVASGEPSQLTGQLGVLESKTSSGDARNAVDEARRSFPPYAQNGGPGGTQRAMPTTAIAR